MLSCIYSAGIFGIDGYIVTVEADGQPRLPNFELVGLPDMAVKEARERVRTACINSGYRFPEMSFMLNLAESLVIVILIIMFAMGLRSGSLIGSSLIFTIGGTMLLMYLLGEGINRTSLAGFIIAMGMLVDNAIVVTDNAQKSLLVGISLRQGLVRGADGPKWGLLGATVIAIFSFLPLYLAPSAVAEIIKPLFVVIALSLLLSWVLAMTQVPLFGVYDRAHDKYQTVIVESESDIYEETALIATQLNE